MGIVLSITRVGTWIDAVLHDKHSLLLFHRNTQGIAPPFVASTLRFILFYCIIMYFGVFICILLFCILLFCVVLFCIVFYFFRNHRCVMGENTAQY